MRSLATDAEKQERQEMIALLRTTPPNEFLLASEQSTIEAFHRQLREVPAYREIFRNYATVAPDRITDIQSFRKYVPILDKHNTFAVYAIRDLCRGGALDDARSFLTSSGHSGVFSFGINTVQNLVRSARSIDMGLEYVFGVDKRRTLLINALPMGVKVNTRATVLAETSVRDDMVFALVRKFNEEFDQIIIVAEGSFAKKIVEDGSDLHGIDWRTIPVNLITGEEGIAENYRDYMAKRIGSRLDGNSDKFIMSSMGVAELDLNIFHETADTIHIRRLAHRDPALRKALFGDKTTACPMFFVYYPHRCYVEEHPTGQWQPELVLSMLSEEMKIPLLRYRTGDLGRIYTYEEVVRTLADFGHHRVPELKLPFVAVYGRGASVSGRTGTVTPEEIKEALYLDHAIAELVTGNFRLHSTDGLIRLNIQMRKNKLAPNDVARRFSKNLEAITPVTVNAEFTPYGDFPYMMEVDWERKFRYI
jgi:phenylacetate-coenzyme A ligase PaaK-like adenylate-forming protein